MGRLYEPLTATINIVVATEAPLRREAMVDLLRVAVEAKVAAVNELLPWCRRRPLGTVTDAAIVAVPADAPEEIVTAGAATTIGGPVADTVESLIVRLWRRLNTGTEALKLLLGPYAERLEDETLEELTKLVEDRPELLALLLAARHLDLHREYHTLPEELATPELLALCTKMLSRAPRSDRPHLDTVIEAVLEGTIPRRGATRGTSNRSAHP